MSRDHFATQQPCAFELPISIQLADTGDTDIIGHVITRALPGKRLACFGTMDGRAIFFKLFLDPERARTHWQRDQEGIEALLQAGIPTPAMLYHAETKNPKGFITVFEKIDPAESAYARWQHASLAADKQAIVKALFSVLAQQHQQGICQQDQHLNNYLFSDNELYTLDGDGIAKQLLPLSREQSLKNLALLIAQLYPQDYALAKALLPDYVKQRDWLDDAADLMCLEKWLKTQASERLGRMLKKVYRDCSAFSKLKFDDRHAMLDRAYTSDNMHQFLHNPEAQLPTDATTWLKNGNTCTVWAADIQHVKLVVKRYNIKNLQHGLNRAFRRTRASISWENAHRLAMNGIPTPRPIALVEKKKGPITREAYFITQFEAGVSCRDYFKATDTPASERQAMAKKVTRLLQNFFALRFTHGDLKASNLLICDDNVIMIDLDSMQAHQDEKTFERAKEKDIKRFLQNWAGDDITAGWFVLQ